MKKTLILLAILLVSLPAMPQGKKYQKGMLKAIQQMDEAVDAATFKEAGAAFESFAESQPTEWIPSYYAALCYIDASFEESNLDDKDKTLDQAQKSLGYALKIAPGESELHVLQAFYYMGVISVEPDIRGPEYYEDALYSLEKAEELNPENPRATFLKALMILNMPEFLGGGPESAKPLFLEAEKNFKAFKNENPLWPSWGAAQVEEELERLKDI